MHLRQEARHQGMETASDSHDIRSGLPAESSRDELYLQPLDGCQISEHVRLAFLGIGYPTILNGSGRFSRYCRGVSRMSPELIPDEVEPLFRPFKVNGLSLANRLVMAPMTRSRSPGGVPGPDVAPPITGGAWKAASA